MAEKILIAYYSKTGNTKRAAEEIAKMTGGTLHRIVPQKTYPDSYFATVAVAKWESLKGEKPALADKVEGIGGYDKILVGFPIWWFCCPQLIKTFMESYDFDGKKVYPFCTHGGSGPKNSTRDIKAICPKADVKDCFDATKNLNEAAVKEWLK